MYSDPRTGNTVKQTIKGKRRYSRVIFGRKQNAHTLIRILRNSDEKNENKYSFKIIPTSFI